jgi:hypothetical protein
MVVELPEQLLEQANFLLTLTPNQANLRRAVSAAYYSLFHLLVRSAVLKWSEPLHQARIARIFEHDRMKKVSGATISSMGTRVDSGGYSSIEINSRIELKKVARFFVRLQHARHAADYNLEEPLDLADATEQVGEANSAFVSWETAHNSTFAKEYLFSLLFKEKERP